RAEECLKIIDQAGNPGSFLVDIIPALKYVPEWVPGAGFKRKAREWRGVADRFGTIPFEFVKSSMAEGTAKSSFTSIALRDISEKDDRAYQEELIKGLGGTMYTAGADTTVSIILTFFLAMLMNPDAQTKAQEEIDRVIGTDRLPTFDDEAKLPYVSALAREVFRWQQVAPFAIPHRLMEDDVYNGYFLPKDSIVLGNAWAILHDDKLFSDPFTFDPERFAAPDADPRLPAAVDYAFGSGGASPEKFECSIKPRSRDAEALVRATAQ
ncbi:cytochrome P450, partial [Gloeopeniophorella convolvens]